ncbi:LuxR C-terminal-related transcriptional regulator [Streptomyces yangpuensis]|uniref:helix-turn-helix transcriptional regulator n=1 Tax=Streptomyces yangpuensis TaxID=1648182 RepID=UPI00371C2995
MTRLFSHRGWAPIELEGDHAAPSCDVLVVDIDRIDEVRDPAPIVALVQGTDVRHLAAQTADVRAIVDQDDLDEAFLEAVHEVAGGLGWISPTLVRPLLLNGLHGERPGSRPHPPRPAAAYASETVPAPRSARFDPALTAREAEVASLVTQGMNNSEIAGALYIAESTVKFHMSNILQKTGSRDRSQLAARMPTRLPVAR